MKVLQHEKMLMQQLKALIENDLHRHYSLQELAEHIGMSKSKLKQLFFLCFGKQPYAYLRELRMQRAWVLLAEKEMSVKQVSFALGFKRIASFSTAFKKRFGINASKVPEE